MLRFYIYEFKISQRFLRLTESKRFENAAVPLCLCFVGGCSKSGKRTLPLSSVMLFYYYTPEVTLLYVYICVAVSLSLWRRAECILNISNFLPDLKIYLHNLELVSVCFFFCVRIVALCDENNVRWTGTCSSYWFVNV